MTYIVYNVNTHSDKQSFESKRGASISCTAMNKKYDSVYAVASLEEFENEIVMMVEKTNLMSGEKYMERSDTPRYCSPSSEAYWSM